MSSIFCQDVIIATVAGYEVRSSSLWLMSDKKAKTSALNGTESQMSGVSGAKISDIKTESVGTAVTIMSQRVVVGDKSGKAVYIIPEHVDVFAFHVRPIPRWSCNEHDVFNLLAERENAAMRYFLQEKTMGRKRSYCLPIG